MTYMFVYECVFLLLPKCKGFCLQFLNRCFLFQRILVEVVLVCDLYQFTIVNFYLTIYNLQLYIKLINISN